MALRWPVNQARPTPQGHHGTHPASAARLKPREQTLKPRTLGVSGALRLLTRFSARARGDEVVICLGRLVDHDRLGGENLPSGQPMTFPPPSSP